jgi:GMP synthase (glutamine-hydrolysing)
VEDPKLKSKMWLSALIQRCSIEGIFAAIVRRGDADAGAMIVKLNRLNGSATVFTQARDGQGRLGWIRALGPDPVPEAEADAYIARQSTYDEDLWVVEIEDRQGRHPMIEPFS